MKSAIHWRSIYHLLDIVPDNVVGLRCRIYMPGFHICVLQAIGSNCLWSPRPALSFLSLGLAIHSTITISGMVIYWFFISRVRLLFRQQRLAPSLTEHWSGHSLQLVKQIYKYSLIEETNMIASSRLTAEIPLATRKPWSTHLCLTFWKSALAEHCFKLVQQIGSRMSVWWQASLSSPVQKLITQAKKREVAHLNVTKAVGPGLTLHFSCSARIRRRNSLQRLTYQSIWSVFTGHHPP